MAPGYSIVNVVRNFTIFFGASKKRNFGCRPAGAGCRFDYHVDYSEFQDSGLEIGAILHYH
jgi:hypothetical protein